MECFAFLLSFKMNPKCSRKGFLDLATKEGREELQVINHGTNIANMISTQQSYKKIIAYMKEQHEEIHGIELEQYEAQKTSRKSHPRLSISFLVSKICFTCNTIQKGMEESSNLTLKLITKLKQMSIFQLNLGFINLKPIKKDTQVEI